jgi:hypothetical protein
MATGTKFSYCKDIFHVEQTDYEFYNLEKLNQDKYGL